MAHICEDIVRKYRGARFLRSSLAWMICGTPQRSPEDFFCRRSRIPSQVLPSTYLTALKNIQRGSRHTHTHQILRPRRTHVESTLTQGYTNPTKQKAAATNAVQYVHGFAQSPVLELLEQSQENHMYMHRCIYIYTRTCTYT